MKTLDDTTKAIIVLQQARELLSDPKRWVQGHFDIGHAFCAAGAIEKVAGRGTDVEDDAYYALANVIDVLSDGTDAIASFNDDDSTTHADVLAAFDLAIERLRDG